MYRSSDTIDGYIDVIVAIREEAREQGMSRLHVTLRAGEKEVQEAAYLPLELVDVDFGLTSSTGRARGVMKHTGSGYGYGGQDPLGDIGNALYTAIFGRQVGAVYRDVQWRARRENRGVRLRLWLDEPIRRFPWEFMRDDSGFLNLSPWTPVFRTAARPDDRRAVEGTPLHARPRGTRLAIVIDKARVGRRPQMHAEKLAAQLLDEPRSDARLVFDEDEMIQYVTESGSDPTVLSAVLFVGGESLFRRLERLLREGRFRPHLFIGDVSQQAIAILLGADLSSSGASLPPFVIHGNGADDGELVRFVGELFNALQGGYQFETAVIHARQALDVSAPDERVWGMPVVYVNGDVTFRFADDAAGADEIAALMNAAQQALAQQSAFESAGGSGKEARLLQYRMRQLEELLGARDRRGGTSAEYITTQIEQLKTSIADLTQSLRGDS